MEVRRYTPELSDHWQAVIDGAKNGTFLLERGFMDYHADRFEDHSVIVYHKDKPVMAVPAHATGDEVVSHGGLTYGGFIYGYELRLPEVLGAIYHVLSYYEAQGLRTMVIKQIPDFYVNPFGDEVAWAMFKLGAECFRMDEGFVTDLQAGYAFQTRRKRSVKKGRKAGYDIRQDEDFAPFWEQVLTPTLQARHDAEPVHSLGEIRLLHERFPAQIQQWSAYDAEGTIQAGTTLFITSRVVHAQYIAGSETGRREGGIDLLFHQLITETFAGKRYFSFGIANEDHGQTLNKGLADWKEGFGARAWPHRFWRIPVAKHEALEKFS